MVSRMRTLIQTLNEATLAYNKGVPYMTDADWDALYFELSDLETITGIHYGDSPTSSIMYDTASVIDKVYHSHPMLSLQKTKNPDDIETFIANHECITMAKMDGLTCSLEYRNGVLVAAETRGNGYCGENILHNAYHILSIPEQIPCAGTLIVDGEIIVTRGNLDKWNEEHPEQTYSNLRNYAAGSIRLLSSSESAARHLDFIAWDVIDGIEADKLSEKLDKLDELGFTTVPRGENIQERCKRLGYPIDGLVFKYDNCKEYMAAGRTEHHFNGGMAYKFFDESVKTVLRNIEWTMGRTGVLTPVAIFDEVEIDGTKVSRASLHNVSIMKATLGDNPYVGEGIKVIKTNMIIPQIIDADKLCIGWTEKDDDD